MTLASCFTVQFMVLWIMHIKFGEAAASRGRTGLNKIAGMDANTNADAGTNIDVNAWVSSISLLNLVKPKSKLSYTTNISDNCQMQHNHLQWTWVGRNLSLHLLEHVLEEKKMNLEPASIELFHMLFLRIKLLDEFQIYDIYYPGFPY